ncbi:MAG: AAA family ATPase [Myxococcota bacterium]
MSDQPMMFHSAHLDRSIDLLLAYEAKQKGEPVVRMTPPPEQGMPLPSDPLTSLIRLFQLSPFEADVLRLTMAPELDEDVANAIAQLRGDRRFRRPTVGLCLKVLEPEVHRRPYRLPAFQEAGALRRTRLLSLVAAGKDHVPLLSDHELVAGPEILLHLVGVESVAPELEPLLRLRAPQLKLENLVLLETLEKQLLMWIRLARLSEEEGPLLGPPAGTERLLLSLLGGYGSGRHACAEVLARAWRLRLLEVDLRQLGPTLEHSTETLRLVLREARRLGAIPVFAPLEELHGDRPGEERPRSPLLLERFLETVESHVGPVVLIGEKPLTVDARWRRQSLVLTLPGVPEEEQRVQLWKRSAKAAGLLAEAVALEDIARRFAFTPGRIQDAVRAARGIMRSRDPLTHEVWVEELHAGSVQQMRSRLESLSRKGSKPFEWGDLILPEGVKQQLQMFEGFVRNRYKVYETWGVGRKMTSGRGVKALFFGTSGTGKTMAASVIASQLNLDLYKVDLSSIVSKWVGETEKNLDRVFTEAGRSHALILFDEADALFGKRGAVERGTDRYSNMEINYLLQRFEEFEGVVILTSNFPRGIDDAFSRRMQFVVEFPFPDPEMRLRLWKAKLPGELPLAADVKLERLAEKFELSGANIQNVMMGAAFLAAEHHREVGMLDFMRAVQWEYAKIGRSITRSEFEEYFEKLS